MYSSFNTGITNNLGVASCNLNYHSNGSVTASYSNISATASIVSNYVPPSVTLTEPITYSFIDNTTIGGYDICLTPCEWIGDPVDTISGLYNPPLPPEELWPNSVEVVSFVEGEQMNEPEIDLICYAVALYYDARIDDFVYLTVNYSTTDGTNIIITVTD